MTKTQETQIALHEQRISAIEISSSRVESKIDLILEKLSTTVVTKSEYEKDVEAQKEVNDTVEKELESIKKNMVTKADMENYNRSQFWQKVMTSAGTAFITITIALIVYELTK